MIEEIKKTREYLGYLERHYKNVQKAWGILKEKCSDMAFIYDDFNYHTINQRIKNHDKSKLSAEEFVTYRKNFFPVTDTEKEESGFATAWEHHKANNRHHWENWTKNEGNYPVHDLVENIVDWMAMGMVFGDTARDYYEKNKEKIELPDWAVILMNEIFDNVYGKEEFTLPCNNCPTAIATPK